MNHYKGVVLFLVILISISSCSNKNRDYNPIEGRENYADNDFCKIKNGLFCKVEMTSISIFPDLNPNTIRVINAGFCREIVDKRICERYTYNIGNQTQLFFWFELQNAYDNYAVFEWYFDGEKVNTFVLPKQGKILFSRYRGNVSKNLYDSPKYVNLILRDGKTNKIVGVYGIKQ